jgi:Fungal specific transcription factor domain
MGMHRQPSTLSGPEATKQRLLFWFIYACDRALALNFGRTPNIHDYDITIDRPKVEEDLDETWGEYFLGWIDFAELQGAILEQLFSARAQKESQEVRTQRARALGEKLEGLYQDFTRVSRVATWLIGLIYESRIMNFSVLSLCRTHTRKRCGTSLCRCKSRYMPWKRSSTDASLQSNRHILSSSPMNASLPRAKRYGTYNWTLLFVPFIPFIVVFGNTIAQNSREDLLLLEGTVKSLQSVEKTAKATTKLKTVCERFTLIAQVYMSQQEESHLANAGNEKQQSSMMRNEALVEMMANPPDPSHFVDSTVGGSTFAGGAVDGTMFESLPDFPWDGVLNEWDLGLGAESAREMSSFTNLGQENFGQPGFNYA